MLRDKLRKRLAACKLEMSPSKTKIVYCKDQERTETYPEIGFDFLGYTFRPRKSVTKDGAVSLNFLPAISGKAAKAIRQTVRDWGLKRKTPISLEEIAKRINPVVRLAKWIARKHKRVHGSLAQAFDWLRRIRRTVPGLFAHWDLDYQS
ncbi:MAG: hypothetical protein JF606_24965 [Burkholderiales bacterium]|nr:hypothetical protein [Burkholderiales bacterium]